MVIRPTNDTKHALYLTLQCKAKLWEIKMKTCIVLTVPGPRSA